jgi:hypothetical protein
LQVLLERVTASSKPELGQPANASLWWPCAGAWDGVLLKIAALGDPPAAHRERYRRARGRSPPSRRTPRASFSAIADDTVIMIDEENGVSFTGFSREDVEICPRGALVGAWVKVEGDSLSGGFFRAKWEGPLGDVRGHLRGRWGVLGDGTKVFVGKIIDGRGHYAGFVRGTWEPDPVDTARGTFRGRWLHREGDAPARTLGSVNGTWGVSDRVTDGGLMRGTWKKDCGEN